MPTTSLNGRLPCRTAQLEIKKLIASQENVLACDGNLAREPLFQLCGAGAFAITAFMAILRLQMFGADSRRDTVHHLSGEQPHQLLAQSRAHYGI